MRPDCARLLPEKIRPQDKVLDVGGWHSPILRSNAIIDIMPHSTINWPGAILTDVWPEPQFDASSYVQMDICGPDPWPFADKEFDFAICSHTLEDVRDPIFVCRELNRVAKAGYIEVPSRAVESTRGVERPFFCGYYHHRWLCEVEGTEISFLFKPAMLHAYRKFHFNKPFFKRMNPEHASSYFFWNGEFQYRERIIIDRDEVQKDLEAFKKTYPNRREMFVPKYNWLGQRI